MTKSNVELLERGYAEYNSRGYETILSLLDPEIAWYNPPDSMDRGVWHGRDGVREWFEEFAFVVFSELRFEPERYIELGEGERVLALVRGFGRGRESGAWVEVPFAHLWTFHEGKLTELRMFSDRRQAFKAAGVEPQK